MKYSLILIIISSFFVSCGDNAAQPKPKAFLALEYPTPIYKKVEFPCSYYFEINEIANLKSPKIKNPCWVDIDYPLLDGTIFITYQPVNSNLKELLMDAQKLPLEHTVKADEIEGDTYINKKKRSFGTFYEVYGDAASQAQFYLTDSLNHFLTGSIYFKSKPNFDSIVPAANYLKNDIKHLMESVTWENWSPQHQSKDSLSVKE